MLSAGLPDSVRDCVSMRVSSVPVGWALKPLFVLEFSSLVFLSGGALMESLQSWSQLQSQRRLASLPLFSLCSSDVDQRGVCP